MATEHPKFIQPSSLNSKIFRYLSLDKLIHFLSTKQLYFSRVDKFDDPFEGAISKPTKELEEEWKNSVLAEHKNVTKDSLDEISLVRENLRKFTFVNCWHLSETESFAMWKIYSQENKGIAIQSTYQTLWDCLPEKHEKYTIQMGLVQYYDSENDVIPVADNLFSPFMFKRKEFEWEQEVRALIMDLHFYDPNKHWESKVKMWIESGAYEDTKKLPPMKEPTPFGIYVPISKDCLHKLIQKIYISPSAPHYFIEVVTKTLQQYGFEPSIISKSSLDTKPIF